MRQRFFLITLRKQCAFPISPRTAYLISSHPEYHVVFLLTVAYLRAFCRIPALVNTEGVSFVFFLVGLTIKLGELAGAALNVRLNVLTQAFSLGVLPAVGLGLATVLAAGGMHPALADGVLILVGGRPLRCSMCRTERPLVVGCRAVVPRARTGTVWA